MFQLSSRNVISKGCLILNKNKTIKSKLYLQETN